MKASGGACRHRAESGFDRLDGGFYLGLRGSSLQEERSAALYCEVLKARLAVESGYLRHPHGLFRLLFLARRPRIGILAEYDALSGLSQRRGAHPEELVPGGCDTAAGTNLLGSHGRGAGSQSVSGGDEAPRDRGAVRPPGRGGGAAKSFVGPDGPAGPTPRR